MSMVIGNPVGAYGHTGIENNQRTVYEMATSGAVAADDVVVFDALTGTDEIVSVHKADVSADNPALIAGVALNAATASGDVIKVVVHGPAIVNCGDATIAAGDGATFHATTDGAADGSALAATEIVGDYFGIFLSANDVPATDKAIVFVSKL